MKLKRPKHLGWIITAIVVVGFIVFSMIPKPMKVETHVVQRQLLRTTIDAEGRVRFVERYSIAMPSTGTIERIELEPGDSVLAGQVVAYFSPPELDARQRIEARANANAADALHAEAKQQLATIAPLLEQNRRRSERLQRLLDNRAVSKEQAEIAADAHAQTLGEVASIEERIRATKYQAQSARAAASATPGQRVAILSPVTGVVLRRFEEHKRTLPAGSPLMEIGDPSQMEIVIDVLSTDAVRVPDKAKVLIDGWGGTQTLTARVSRVEPAARVKVSSLGVEEKRVDVIATLESKAPSLGDGYKVDAGIVVWEKDGVVTVPLGALVRDDDRWYVFVVEDGTAKRRDVTLGQRSALYTSVDKGLKAKEIVILHPSEDITEGSPVE